MITMRSKKPSPSAYEKLKIFFVCYVDWFVPVGEKSQNPEDQPIAFLENLEKKSTSDAKRGLQMAVNDVVEMTADWSPQKVAEADAKFSSRGAFTLSEVRRRYSRRYLQILRRGSIKSDLEYYFLKGIDDSGELPTLSDESEKIGAMLADYEEKLTGAAPR